ncbi:hypothetical protein [Massilibacteroides sp.]|uniref:hypothetical protein n=1 Tax=Massilibacteroides sp. TaxID=2034766 RepID=UPI002601902D|nr:hypothetical protein [Massilibacteroides sp.]MDD4515635.1 hypothetical protein [Massilibacteroides sp.]
MNYRIPEIAKKTAAEITDLTDYSIEIGKESDLNKRSYGLLLSQLQLLIGGSDSSMSVNYINDESFTPSTSGYYHILAAHEVIITLPAISESNDGMQLYFKNANAGTITVNRTGSDVIFETSNVNTYSITGHSSHLFVAINSIKKWIIFSSTNLG